MSANSTTEMERSGIRVRYGNGFAQELMAQVLHLFGTSVGVVIHEHKGCEMSKYEVDTKIIQKEAYSDMDSTSDDGGEEPTTTVAAETSSSSLSVLERLEVCTYHHFSTAVPTNNANDDMRAGSDDNISSIQSVTSSLSLPDCDVFN
jgi:hypothetical protein